MIDRRTMLAAGAATLAASRLAAQDKEVTLPADVERFPIWPVPLPGADRVTVKQTEVQRPHSIQDESSAVEHVTTPSLSLIRPARPNGASILIIPGGGYRRVAIGHEGHVVARWYAARGYMAYALLYRLPDDGWAPREEVSLADAQRAMRVIRARATQAKLAPDRVGLIGFSAGGHLAARLTTQFDRTTYQPVDASDMLSARPTASALIYPVITLGGRTHSGSRDAMLGADSSPERIAAYSAETLVRTDTPPTFLTTAGDDQTVPIENSMTMYSALRARSIPSELHIFETGGHGFGLRLPDRSESPWPTLFETFARRHGLVA